MTALSDASFYHNASAGHSEIKLDGSQLISDDMNPLCWAKWKQFNYIWCLSHVYMQVKELNCRQFIQEKVANNNYGLQHHQRLVNVLYAAPYMCLHCL